MISKKYALVAVALVTLTIGVTFSGTLGVANTAGATSDAQADSVTRETFSQNSVVDDVTIDPTAGDENYSLVTVSFDETPRDEVRECNYDFDQVSKSCSMVTRPVTIEQADVTFRERNESGASGVTVHSLSNDGMAFYVPHTASNATVTLQTAFDIDTGHSTLYIEFVPRDGELTSSYRAIMYE